MCIKLDKVNIRTYYFISKLAFIPQLAIFLLRGIPPEFLKREILKKILKNHRFDNAVETGTYFARTTNLLSKHTRIVHSIEISEELFEFVKNRNSKKNIIFHKGASEILFSEILNQISGDTIFYLDSHASGGRSKRGPNVTSLHMELQALAKFTNLQSSLIMIDDAIGLNGTNGYPDLDYIAHFAKKNNLSMYKTNRNLLIIMGQLISSKNMKKILD